MRGDMELLKVRSGLSPLVSSPGSALQAACMSNLSIAVRIVQRLHAGSLFCPCPSRQAGVGFRVDGDWQDARETRKAPRQDSLLVGAH
jgi:hypothetical protein